MKLVIAAALVLAVAVESARHVNLYKNKRIIKVRVPPRQHPDFYKGPKGYLRPNSAPIRFKEFSHGKHGPDFIRPNSLPPPPFPFGGYGNAHVKHQSRPPPNFSGFSGFSGSSTFANFGKGFQTKEIYHKLPQTYGSSFPHKATVSKFKFPSVKDEIRITHTQTQTSLPAPPPTLAPTVPSSPPHSSSASLASSYTSSASVASSYSSSNTYRPSTPFYSSSPHIHSSDDDRGPIREIPAPNLGPAKPESDPTFHVNAYANYGKGPSIDVTNLVGDTGAQQLTFPATEYYSAFGQPSHNFDLVTDNHISTTSTTFGSSDSSAAHADVASSLDDTSETLYKNSQVSVSPLPSPSTGYEVTEELHTGSGQTGTGQTGTSHSDASQFYYAPDPDPSAPVHKVPPTKEVFVDEKTAETYVPRLAQQNFQVLEGGSVPAPVTTLSPQELFHLMHGFPNPIIQQAIVAEPVVTILQPNYAYAQAGGQYSQAVGQYEQQVGAEYLQQAQELARQHSAYIQQQQQQQQQHQDQNAYGVYLQQTQQQQAYVPEQQYQSYDSDYSSQGSDSQASFAEGQYEPEASESRKSLTKMDEESLNSVETSSGPDENQIIIHFNKMPEVPFFATLPNKEAAEALASLQAAGSIGSTYASPSKAGAEEEAPSGAAELFVKLRGDQAPEEDDAEGAAEQDVQVPSLGLPQEGLVAPQKVEASGGESTGTNVEIQKSVSVFETSYPASSLLDNSQSDGSEAGKKSYGQRIRPK